jgi:uncharacterized protein (DUF58 family)
MTLLMGVSAVNTGNNLLYLLVAGLLAFMSVSGLAGWLNIRALAITLDLPGELYRNRPAPVAVTIYNGRGLFPSLILEARLNDGAILFPVVPARCRETRTISVTFSRRGVVHLQGLTVASRFPINFFVRTVRLPLDMDIIVFPEPLATNAAVAGGLVRHGTYRSSVLAGEGGDIRRIGDYTGAESLRMIHWRLSARHGELKVKEFEALAAEPVVIDLEGLQGGNLEGRLSRATFLVNSYFRQGRSVGIRGKGIFVPPGGGRQHRLLILRELACHDAL